MPDLPSRRGEVPTGLKDGDVPKRELNKNNQSEIKLNFDFQKSGFGLEMCHIIMCGAC